nr:putative gypsy type transposon [Paspalum simplex]
MASSLRSTLAEAFPDPKHSFSEITDALGTSAGRGGEMVAPGVPLRRVELPAQPLRRKHLGFIRNPVGESAPNSILMMATFAYLCKAFVGTRQSPRTDFIHYNLPGKWDGWKRSWFYICTDVNRRLRVPHRVTARPDWEACPEIDEAWEPVLKRITALRATGLHSMALLAHFTARRIAPLQRHEEPMWLYTGPARDNPGGPAASPGHWSFPTAGGGGVLPPASAGEEAILGRWCWDLWGFQRRRFQRGGDPYRSRARIHHSPPPSTPQLEEPAGPQSLEGEFALAAAEHDAAPGQEGENPDDELGLEPLTLPEAGHQVVTPPAEAAQGLATPDDAVQGSTTPDEAIQGLVTPDEAALGLAPGDTDIAAGPADPAEAAATPIVALLEGPEAEASMYLQASPVAAPTLPPRTRRDHLAEVDVYTRDKVDLAAERIALALQREAVAAGEAKIAAREEAAAKAIEERDSLAQVAARISEVDSYWKMCKAVGDLDIPLPELPPTPSRNSLRGLGPALSALAGSLASGKAELDASLQRRDARLGSPAQSMRLGWPNARSPTSTRRPWVTRSLTVKR